MRVKRMFLLTLCLNGIILIALSPVVIWAGQTGKLAGKLTDAETGDALPGANVVLEGTTLGAACDLEGYYVILNVPPGTYNLRASMMGYAPHKILDVKVSLDLTTKIDIKLSQEALEMGEVIVVAEQPIVQNDLTASLQIVRSEDIVQMPVESLADVLELQAGITKDSEGRIHIRGGRASEVTYLIDGVSVTDPFAGELSVEVENSGIEQLQVISGGFNAEYGQALSGVVDIITKEGREKYHGSISAYVGDYMSTDDEIFFNVNNVNITDLYNIQGNLNGPVPFFNKKLTFNVNARYLNNKGWLYGQRRFSPTDSSNFEDANAENWSIKDITLDEPIIGLDNYRAYAETQNYEAVPMNSFEKISLQGKLAYRFSPQIKFSVGGLYDDVDFREYNHRFQLNPDGDFRQFRNGLTITPILTHSVSANTFYTAKFSYLKFDVNRYVFENPLDPRYADPKRLEDSRQNAFLTGGTSGVATVTSGEQFNIDRETTTLRSKFDLTSQVTRSHQIKTGIEVAKYKLKYEEFEIIPEVDEFGIIKVPFQAAIPPITSFNHNMYNRKPIEFAAYIQDKIELQEIIINIGVRFDYFDARGIVPTDFRDPSLTRPIRTIDIFQGNELLYNDVPFRVNSDDSRALIDPKTGEPFSESIPQEARFIDAAGNDVSARNWSAIGSWFESSRNRSQVSPRIGISYPITDRAAVHFSYGFFFQNPTFEHLYINPEFEINPERSGVVNTLIGNANLKNQKTINYEMGLQQQLGENIGFFLTGFYKDINNWIGTQIVETYIAGDRYGRFVNLDYGNVRGVTVAFDLRPSRNVSAFIDYTFQVAEGNASDPEAVFADVRSSPPRESEIQTVPLDWDQRHTLNLTLNFNQPKQHWGIGIIGKLNTGNPYTPTLRATRGVRASFENSERKPTQINFDIKGHKDLRLAGLTYSLFFKIFNVFDARNEDEVFSSTGQAGATTDILFAGRVQGVNTLEEWFARPNFYTEPRRVQVGFALNF